MPSLSRTYRPQTFADITGQEPVKETLRLEVETGKTGHAYLFSGPRGIGKTTLARVFAKALNCLKPKKGEPCNACDNCKAVMEGRMMDFIEMDAASKSGVDNVREAIIEHVRFAPTGRKFKIYVLDEAHMLSTSAWNALLKTIEEPPPYAVFIFITTELHKVPATIQSRCQRFDFKRVSDAALAERLKSVAEKEKVAIDDDVVKSIVAKSDGCVRDAETFLGQLLSLGETNITTDLASLVLPISRLPLAAETLGLWSKRNLGPALEQIEKMEEQGIPFLPLFDDLLQAVRLLILAADSVTWRTKLADGDDGERALASLVNAYEPAELADMALMLMERRRDAKQGADVRFCLELAASAVCLGLLPHGPGPRNREPSTVNRAESANREPSTVNRAESANREPSTVNREIPTHGSRTTENGSRITDHGSPITDHGSPITAHGSPQPSLSLTNVLAKWPAVLRAIDEKSPSLAFIMKIARPVAAEGSRVTIEFQYPYHRDKIINDIKTKRLVEDALRGVCAQANLTIDGVVGQEDPKAKEAREANTVSSILKAFGGHIVEESGTP